VNVSFNFPGTRVLVTGGTSGIGEAVAIAFAKAGADVVITGRDQARGQAVLGTIHEAGRVGEFIAGDLCDPEFCDSLVEQANQTLGGLDVVVNCAGVIFHADAVQTSDAQWRQTMDVNVNATFYVCRAALKIMTAGPGGERGGVILNIASDAGLSASTGLTAYNASKGAVIQMSRSMAKDFGKHNIRVIPICPGDVDTPMLRGEFEQQGVTAEAGLRESAGSVPLNRVCSPGEIADLVLYAASDSAAFMSGFPLVLDAGNRA
jgi:NAD(P)-dependent dehydrogenase (short-subunit alcohol dehydrogenase family)